ISGSMSSELPETGAALFRSPTSSSNSEANTEDGMSLLTVSTSFSFSSSLKSEAPLLKCEGPAATSSEGPDASFRCCR
uniref:Uncharacterized protein n=1 Tax=Xiphophorus couchianus TaxID=32473 RepID=A0A3B5M7C7_9TELE